MDNRFYDVAVIGAGPAGLTSALYCRRAEKTVVVFEKDVVGGQVTHSPKIENYPGTAQMSGLDFAERLTEQVKSQGAEIIEAEVTGLLREIDGSWKIILPGGEFYHSSTVIIAAGVHHRRAEPRALGPGAVLCGHIRPAKRSACHAGAADLLSGGRGVGVQLYPRLYC